MLALASAGILKLMHSILCVQKNDNDGACSCCDETTMILTWPQQAAKKHSEKQSDSSAEE